MNAKKNKSIAEVVIDYQLSIVDTTKEIYDELYKILDVMHSSSMYYTDRESKTKLGMIDGFANKMMEYSVKDTISENL